MDTGTIDAGVWKSAPGKGRKTPKGRQASETAIVEVQALIGSRPRERQLLHRLRRRLARLRPYASARVARAASGGDRPAAAHRAPP